MLCMLCILMLPIVPPLPTAYFSTTGMHALHLLFVNMDRHLRLRYAPFLGSRHNTLLNGTTFLSSAPLRMYISDFNTYSCDSCIQSAHRGLLSQLSKDIWYILPRGSSITTLLLRHISFVQTTTTNTLVSLLAINYKFSQYTPCFTSFFYSLVFAGRLAFCTWIVVEVYIDRYIEGQGDVYR
jgi:hypothetical protein